MTKQTNKTNQVKEERDHEMESLKNRISTLEGELNTRTQELKNKTAAYDALLNSETSASGRCQKLEEEIAGLKEKLANGPVTSIGPTDGETAVGHWDSAPSPLGRSVPPEIRAALVVFAIGAIRDRQNDGPLDKKNFEHIVDPFIDQAEYIADRVIERMNAR